MSNAAINWAYRVKAGGARNKAVLVALANFANDDGQCWPYIRKLVKATELCDRAVRSALADLEKRRLISRQPQFLDGTKYRRNELITLHLDMVQDVQDDGALDAGYPAPDAGYGAGRAGYIRHDVPGHPAPGAGHIEPSLNHQVEPKENQICSLAIVEQSFDKEFDERFWPLYPNKVGKPKAKAAFVKARESGAPLDLIMDGLRCYVRKNDYREWCNPATWLNQERWADEPAASPAKLDPVIQGLQLAYAKRFGDNVADQAA